MEQSDVDNINIASTVSLNPASNQSTSRAETGERQNDKSNPLFIFVKYLANIPTNEESTVLSNSQLMDILEKDFLRDVSDKPALAIDIYLNVLKKFLKSWPRWDEYDRTIKDLKRNHVSIDNVLVEEYLNLKTYLEEVLLYMETQMQPIIEQIESKNKTVHSNAKVNLDDEVVMEVTCTRTQLNNLFYRKPHPENNTIFHISDIPLTSKISLAGVKFKEILNWPNVTIHINLPAFEFVRKNSSSFQRTLMNRKLPENVNKTFPALSSELYWRKVLNRRPMSIVKTIMVSYLLQLSMYIEKLDIRDKDRKEQAISLFKEVKSDIIMAFDDITVNSEYQFFMSRFPYVRYLYKELPEEIALSKETDAESVDGDDYDIQFEEIISPAITFQLLRFQHPFTETKAGKKFNFEDKDYKAFTEVNSNWLKLECNWCDVKFEGFLSLFYAEQHFTEVHSMEPEWQCGQCQRVFSMNSLAASRWFHKC